MLPALLSTHFSGWRRFGADRRVSQLIASYLLGQLLLAGCVQHEPNNLAPVVMQVDTGKFSLTGDALGEMSKISSKFALYQYKSVCFDCRRGDLPIASLLRGAEPMELDAASREKN